MWVGHLKEYLIKKKKHVNKLVLFIYINNTIHTVHSWPFYGVDVVVCLMIYSWLLCVPSRKTQHLGFSTEKCIPEILH